MIVASLNGVEPLLIWALSLMFLFLLLPLVIPNDRVHISFRVISIVSLVVFVSVPFTNWPYMVAFSSQKAMLTSYAERVRSGEIAAGNGTRRVGTYVVLAVRTTPEGNVGLQLSGGAGGGVYLVQTVPGCEMVWYNTNWEQYLGGGWYRVYED
ncbi:MAG: hypothetical protein ED559_10115 [Phycisphaera sp.]|nr:MAG: hypothetical protein ED559_10115 [Phycisphaera sp.]